MATSSDDRVVVLAGANGGIGHHTTTTLVGNGYRVAGLDVDGDNRRDVQDRFPGRVRYRDRDVPDAGDVEAAAGDVIDRWEKIDTLVDNAAVATFAPFGERAAADTRRAFGVNVFGNLRTIRAVLPQMRDRGDGIVHDVGSATGDVGHPGLAGYAVSNGAIRVPTRSLQLALRHTGKSCTPMVPPTTDRRLSAELGYPG